MLKLLPKSILVSFFLLLGTVSTAFADESTINATQTTLKETLEDTIRSLSITSVIIGSVLVLGFVGLTILLKQQSGTLKKLLFAGILAPTVLTTLFLVGSTLTLNAVSSTKGPIHWHADFEIWDCGKKVDLVDPQGFSNKVGTPTLHEHNDLRIHVEGVVVEENDASLQRFFRVIDGDITSTSINIPTSRGRIVRENGDPCPDRSAGTLQVFVYKIKNAKDTQRSNFVYEQTKLENLSSYVLSPFSNVPPGDCLIIEFGSEQKAKTAKMCEQYEVQKLKGNLYGN